MRDVAGAAAIRGPARSARRSFGFLDDQKDGLSSAVTAIPTTRNVRSRPSGIVSPARQFGTALRIDGGSAADPARSLGGTETPSSSFLGPDGAVEHWARRTPRNRAREAIGRSQPTHWCGRFRWSLSPRPPSHADLEGASRLRSSGLVPCRSFHLGVEPAAGHELDGSPRAR